MYLLQTRHFGATARRNVGPSEKRDLTVIVIASINAQWTFAKLGYWLSYIYIRVNVLSQRIRSATLFHNNENAEATTH